MLPLRDNIPLARLPLVTVVLVAIDVIAYLLEVSHAGSLRIPGADSVAVHYGAIPHELTHGERLWTALTSIFLNASLLQTFANLLFLAIFGPTVEDALGRVRFPLLYLLGGLLAVVVQVLAHPSSGAPVLGAGGAGAAVLGAYLVMYPRAQVLAVVPVVFAATIVQVPAIALIGLWLVLQLCFAVAGIATIGADETVALLSVLAGFAFGLAAIRPLLWRVRTGRPLPVY